MNRKDLIIQLAKANKITQIEANAFIDGFLGAVVTSLSKGESVTLVGFGTFEARSIKGRKGINPLTGAPLVVPAYTAARFKAGKALKEAVAK